MAPSSPNMALGLLLSLSLSLLLPAAHGGVVCDELPQDLCAFAISSSSKRCVLESSLSLGGEGPTEYQCRTSDVAVGRMSDWVESDDCVKACGVQRDTVGISSDSLLEPDFTHNLCSPPCYHNCPNIVDLYFNLAAGEGVFLPDLCDAQRANPHRAMVELLSSGVASAPVAGGVFSKFNSAAAPAPVASPVSA